VTAPVERGATRGVSLVDALVALSVASLVLVAVLALYDGTRHAFHVGENALEQQQSARVALDLVESDLRRAGFNIDPDGARDRPDEPIEAALVTAIVLRADFDAEDPTLAADPERGLEGGAFENVSTANDEIRGFLLRPAAGTGPDRLTLAADVAPVPRDGAVESVAIDGVSLAHDAPPYTLYRVTLDNDPRALGSSRFVRFTPVVENVRSLRFRYFDRAGREMPAPGGEDTPSALAARRSIASIAVAIEVLTRDPDPRWIDPNDPNDRTRRFRKLGLETHVTLRNLGTRVQRRRRSCRARDRVAPARRAAGSALVIVLCISVAASFLGLALVLHAETEERIAQNEKRAAQVRYVAESGARVIKRWFDDPLAAPHVPDASVVDRSLRRIRDDADPHGASIGSTPSYKEGVDLDGNGADDLFDRPFTGSVEHELRGTPDGPDLRIDVADPRARAFLDGLSQALFDTVPIEGGGVRARIVRIDVSAPPYIRSGGAWSRAGIATVRVVGSLERQGPSGREILAQRAVEMVLATVPYRDVTGPVLSCGDTVWTGRVGVRWGTIESAGRTIVSNVTELAESVPRSLPPGPGIDPVWDTSDPAAFAAFAVAMDGVPFPDPWQRILSGSDIDGIGASPGVAQPLPPLGTPTGPDRSNLLQRQPFVTCPRLDHETWRSIASSGERGVHFFTWSGASFREDGIGPPRSMRDATSGRTGLFFFDTTDGRPPTDDDGDGVEDNLTPPVELDGNWMFRGVLFSNAQSLRLAVDPVAASETIVRPPGEPYQDSDLDGEFDAGEAHLDLVYPTTAAEIGGAIVAGGGGARDRSGRAIPGVPVALHGILHVRGSFEATGRGTVYGAVVAHGGVTQTPRDGTATTPDILWDATIPGAWPPAGWPLPRVVVAGWNADP